jgi:hypothetical protein
LSVEVGVVVAFDLVRSGWKTGSDIITKVVSDAPESVSVDVWTENIAREVFLCSAAFIEEPVHSSSSVRSAYNKCMTCGDMFYHFPSVGSPGVYFNVSNVA